MQLLQGDRPGPSTPCAESGAQDGLQFVHGFWDFLRYFTITQHHTSVGQGSSMNHDAHPKTWGCGCNRYPGSKQTSRGKRLGRRALILIHGPNGAEHGCFQSCFCESSANLTALSSSFSSLPGMIDGGWTNHQAVGEMFQDVASSTSRAECRAQPESQTAALADLLFASFLPPRMGPPRQQVDVSPTSPQVALA